MARVLKEDRKYPRVRLSAKEKVYLDNHDLQWVLSSFITAIGFKDKDLMIRFINGSIYTYFNKAYLYDNFLKSSSKGKYFWKHIRRKKNVNYSRSGTLPLPSDTDISDEQIFDTIKEENIKVKVKGKTKVKATKVKQKKTKKDVLKQILAGVILYDLLN